MKATVNWYQDLTFNASTDTGSALTLDGNGETTTPMEAVLMSAGTCASIDVVMILQKARQDVTDCRCELEAVRAENPPKVFEKIHATFYLKGKDLSEKQVARAIDLSIEKYCSVMLMLTGKVEISTDFVIEG